jgi:aminoglycoside phosphotransferase (APT) family kinase protein
MSLISLDLPAKSRFRDWLAVRLPDLPDLEITNYASPGVGNSAETILIDARGRTGGSTRSIEFVLRLQMEGADLFLNNDLGWQYQALKAMARFPQVPVPEVLDIEMDRSVLGAPFFVMKRVRGRALPQKPNYNLAGWLVDLPAEERGRAWFNNVEAMARVHNVAWQDGFDFMSKLDAGAPGLDQYLNHIRKWLDWAADGREQPTLQAALEWLRKHRPNSTPVNVVWGDSIPANTLFGNDLRVVALLDWEMACLGPGEIDLAWFLMFDDFYAGYSGVQRLAGIPNRKQVIAAYEEAAGRAVNNLEYYDMLALVRFAIIVIRASARYTASNPDLTFNAHTHNPLTAELAKRLGLPVPEPGDDWARFMAPHR